MKRVLITEDDGLIAEIYRDSFDREGFSAEVATDGAIAIQRLKENPPDIVLLDLMMPNVNGVEVLKYIRSQDALKTLPVIVMSNAFAGALGREATFAGATKMFAKNSCGPKRLVKEVRDIFAAAEELAPGEMSLSGDTTMRVKDFRKDVAGSMPRRVATLRGLIETMAAETPPARERLLEIHRSVHQLASIVSLAGFIGTAQLACALEALIKELNAKPQKVNSSSVRTALEAVDMLGALAARGTQSEDGISSPLILVADDDAISRVTTCTALEQARLRALSVGDPHIALKLAKDNRFDLLLMDIQMPEMNGFELYEQIQATASNANTPVIFVTALNDFEEYVRTTRRGGMDFIAKPITLVELAVKALTCLMKNIPRAA